jgi:hypothetical protein
MTQADYELKVSNFITMCDLVRLEAYAATGYEWMVVPKTGAYRSIKEQHGLYIQATDGIDNDGDGKIDEADERVTKADGGKSPHNFNLARDIVPMIHKGVIWWEAPTSLFKTMADIAVKHGLVSGFFFKSIFDAPHVEHPHWEDVQASWRRKEIEVG